MMSSLSLWELLIIFGIILLLFGGSRLASVGKALGEAVANFKKGVQSVEEEAKQETIQNAKVYSIPSQRGSDQGEKVIEHNTNSRS